MSLSSLERNFLEQHLVNHLLSSFSRYGVHMLNNWCWCIYGRLANLRHVVSQDDLFVGHMLIEGDTVVFLPP